MDIPESIRRLMLALALAAVAAIARAQQEGVHTIAHFEFEGGTVFENMKVGYTTYGKRASDDRNVVVLVPPTSGLKSWANGHIGPGKVFDPEKYFIVSIDAIGGGTSSQPRDGLSIHFPAYNIRDMVRAQHDLLVRGLGVHHALAIGGASSGAYQALEWGILYPDFSRSLLLYVPAAQADQHVKAIADGIVATLGLDPAFADGNAPAIGSEAVKRAAMVYFPWLVSDAALSTMASDEELAKAQGGLAAIWARSWDAVGLAWRYRSSRAHDVAAPFRGNLGEALGKVTAAALIMPVTTDRTHPIEMSVAMRDGMVHARTVYAPLDSPRGHVAVFRPAGTPEYEFVSTRTREFLESVR